MGRSRCSTRWMNPSYPVTRVGCWSGGVRVRRRHLRSGRESAPAKRSGRVSSRRDPSDDQVGRTIAGAPILASDQLPRLVGHVDGPVVRGREDVAARSLFAISDT
ncbi:hypothetical protein GW17_00008580 [Ensete ventricosum]|nr:hypothetical protein GW17_00008580 [Ensete ventricosum]